MIRSSGILFLLFTLITESIEFPRPNNNVPVYGYMDLQTTEDHSQDIYKSLNKMDTSNSRFSDPNRSLAMVVGSEPTIQSESSESQASLSNEMKRLDNLSVPSVMNETKEEYNSSATDPTVANVTVATDEASSHSGQSNSTDNDIAPVTPPSVDQSTHFYSAFYNKTLIWLSDAYTLSILIPVASGFVIAAMVIVLVATCNLLRRRCCGRSLRRKTLTDAIRSMNAKDRAKLLAESSDEEF